MPAVGALIAGIGAWVALQQMRIARTKLRHDLYDRRFATYAAARKLLREVMLDGNASEASIAAFLAGTSESPFLFNDETVRYLEEIGKHASMLAVATNTVRGLLNEDSRSEIDRTIADNLRWLQDQDAHLVLHFQPLLKLEKRYPV
jgi:hypothetical protein